MKKAKIFLSTFILLLVICINKNIFAITPANNDFIQGIDVSAWQGYIDYNRVRQEGIDIVYIKASQGADFKDPYFEVNYENAKSNGLRVGVYHYLTAESITEAEQQARFFASIISGKQIDCKIALDFEEFGDLTPFQVKDVHM